MTINNACVFIALKGHKQLKTSVKKAGGYDILKKNNGGGDGGESTKGMKKVQSLFSLRMDQSIRLQRYGSWIVYHDDQAESVYYYNQTTRTGQWEIPEKIKHIQTQALHNSSAASTSIDGFGKSLQTKLSMRLKKVGDWIQYSTEGGRVFYYNDKNGDFKWVTPDVAESGHNTPLARQQPSTSPIGSHSNPVSAKNSVKQTNSQQEALPEGLSEWRAYKDPTTGAMFWYNEVCTLFMYCFLTLIFCFGKVTKVSQWECPDIATQHQSSHEDSNSQEVVVVNNDEDLGL